MNKTFIAKMLKAKKLEYEAIKEILPKEMQDRISVFEEEAKEFLKEVALEYMKEQPEKKCEESGKVKKVEIN